MLRKYAVALVALFFVAGFALAAEYKGTIKSIDTTGKKIVVTVKDGDNETEKTFTYTDDTKFSRMRKGETEAVATADLEKLSERLGKAKRPMQVTITSDDGKKATKVAFGGGRRKKSSD